MLVSMTTSHLHQHSRSSQNLDRAAAEAGGTVREGRNPVRQAHRRAEKQISRSQPGSPHLRHSQQNHHLNPHLLRLHFGRRRASTDIGLATKGLPDIKNYQQPSWKLWGEQKANDIVYTIYLKKVRYHRPSKSVNSDSEDEISHLEWETVKVKLVKAATLRQLVNSLACADTGELESTYVNIFLATYRTFASTEQVMELLLERYREVDEDIHSSLDRDDDNDDDRDSGNGGPDPAEVREAHLKALRQALAVWLDVYPSDFPPESNAVLKLLEFLNARCPNDTHLHNRVAALVSGVPHTPSNNSIASARMSRRVRLNRDSESSPIDCDDFGGSDRRGHDEIDCHVVRCASPLPNGALTSAAYPSFFHIPEDVFAQQLTRMDKELFVKLQPHQCLGAIWGKSKERLEVAGSVKVTVDQFNAVSFRVLSTVLMDVDQKPSQRAKVIAKWIEIAQELRLLKNFSSLKAIISGLQSTPIYRLRKVWSAVPKEKVESYEELARLFSEDNNQLAQRELLQREGTAKVAEVTSHADRFLPRLLQRHNPAACSVNYGTIPYLGTFLTDLTMINTAIPNTLYDNLINFDKKRKEFEILAQIKLLQGAAASYNIKHDARFQKWFDSCPVLEDKESFELSCLIEVQGPLTPSRGSSGTGNSVNSNSGSNLGGSGKKKGYILSHQKTDSMTSTSSGTSSQHKDETCDSLPSSIPESIGSLERKMSTSSTSSSSGPSVDPASSSTGTAPTPGGGSVSGSSVADSGAGGSASGMSSKDGSSSNASPYRTPDFYIIRVSIESGSSEQQGVNLYKSIMLGNSERTKSVIANAMLKHGVEGRAEDYTLSQILPHGEMMFPNNANVYYAINTSYDLNFILRKKRPGDDDKKGLTVRDHKTRKKLLSLMT